MPANTTTIIFVELLEAPRFYGPARIRIARATAPNMAAGEVLVRFPPRSAGDHEPHGKGDNVLVGFAYDDPIAAYFLASFSGTPGLQSSGNREIHARGGASVRIVSAGGQCEVLLDGGGNISIAAIDGDVSIVAEEQILAGAKFVDIDGVSGVSIFTEVDVEIVAENVFKVVAENSIDMSGDIGIDLKSPSSFVDVKQTGASTPEVVALHSRTSRELIALVAGLLALAAAVDAIHATPGVNVGVVNTAIAAALSGGGPTTIVGSQAAINLRAEPDPL